MVPRLPLVHQDQSGSEFLRQLNGCSFAGPKTSLLDYGPESFLIFDRRHLDKRRLNHLARSREAGARDDHFVENLCRNVNSRIKFRKEIEAVDSRERDQRG